MKATALLKKDHVTVKKLFRDFEKVGERGEKRKQDIFNKMHGELDRHAKIEEEIFYPAMESVPGADEMVEEAKQEHQVVKDLLSEISGLDPGDDEFDAKVKVLTENVEHHIEEEEGEMFPKARRVFSRAELEDLGARMEERKREATGDSAEIEEERRERTALDR
jgi:hemerythrin-like domain-containing protein